MRLLLPLFALLVSAIAGRRAPAESAGRRAPAESATKLPLHSAAWTNDLGALRAALAAKPAQAALDQLDDNKWTALHYASAEANVVAIGMLLSAGASRGLADGNGKAPYDIAGTVEAKGAIDARRFAAAWATGQLHVQVESDQNVARLRTLLWIVQSGKRRKGEAGIDHRDGQGAAPLHVAVGRGSVESARTLLEFGAAVDPLDKHAYTPLHVNGFTGDAAMMRMLLRYKPPWMATTVNGQAPLHIVALTAAKRHRKGQGAELVRLLLGAGAQVDQLVAKPFQQAALEAEDEDGGKADGKKNETKLPNDRWTALHYAARGGRVDVAAALLAGKANVNAKTGTGT